MYLQQYCTYIYSSETLVTMFSL